MPHDTGRARQPTISDKRSNARSAAVSTLRPWSTQSRIRSRGRRFESCQPDRRKQSDPELDNTRSGIARCQSGRHARELPHPLRRVVVRPNRRVKAGKRALTHLLDRTGWLRTGKGKVQAGLRPPDEAQDGHQGQRPQAHFHVASPYAFAATSGFAPRAGIAVVSAISGDSTVRANPAIANPLPVPQNAFDDSNISS